MKTTLALANATDKLIEAIRRGDRVLEPNVIRNALDDYTSEVLRIVKADK